MLPTLTEQQAQFVIGRYGPCQEGLLRFGYHAMVRWHRFLPVPGDGIGRDSWRCSDCWADIWTPIYPSFAERFGFSATRSNA